GNIWIFSIIPNSKGIQSETTMDIVALKDTYVSNGTISSNYGGDHILNVGDGPFGDATEAYYYFDFSNIEEEITKAEISLRLLERPGLAPQINFTVCLIEENWSEYTLNWINKPNKSQVIGYILFNSSGTYEINVSSFISGRSNISICVFLEKFVDYEGVFIYARENFLLYDGSYDFNPFLKLSYMETVETPGNELNIPSYNFLIVIVLISILTVMISKKVVKKL
ncbi:unnamed protein product, partial [marine sediment metagenome]